MKPAKETNHMTTTGPTPGPWRVVPLLTPEADDDPMGVYKVSPAHEILTGQYFGTDPEDEEGEEIALAAIHAENQANADFIALACNSHADLLDNALYLDSVMPEVDCPDGCYINIVITAKAVRDIRAAIAKARGQA